MTSIMWFRRDLRLNDNPALVAAAEDDEVVGVFIIDPQLWDSVGETRRAWVAASVQALDRSMDGALLVRVGDPAEVLTDIARTCGATTVHVTGEVTPFGRRRDARVAAALAKIGVTGEPTGTPYAVDPGTVRNQQGNPFQVFTPFSRGWREVGWPNPVPAPSVTWRRMRNDAEATRLLDEAVAQAPAAMPAAGEEAALERWRWFREEALEDYAGMRDRPDVDGTSRLSPYLKVGAVHPRQLLDGVDPTSKYASEVAWRDFYADVLWNRPDSDWNDLRNLGIDYDEPDERTQAWREGRTGFPVVDAGMRQLIAEGWMHNRVRMIVASFLTKDLHVWWPVGAKHFLEHLIDGDIASNNHGWQWTAGTGTDASPYFRVFNPITQGLKFDPQGDYVRKWIPELAHLPGAGAHEPWKHPLGYEGDYPRPVVDHAVERQVALDRYAARPGQTAP